MEKPSHLARLITWRTPGQSRPVELVFKNKSTVAQLEEQIPVKNEVAGAGPASGALIKIHKFENINKIMNYELVYFNLIDKARNRSIPKGVYCERHHIIPKSLNGSNDKSNFVKLYPREHYIAHLLLFKKFEKLYRNDKAYRNEYIKSLWAMGALYYLPAAKTEEGLRKRVFKGNSRIYSDIKQKLAILSSIRHKEWMSSLSDEEKYFINKKISKSLKKLIAERGSWWSR